MPTRSKLFACIISPDEKRDEEILLSIAYGFAYRVEMLADGVLFDVSGLEKLVGNTHTVARGILKQLKENGISGNVSVAGTIDAALLIARENAGLNHVAATDEKFRQLPLRNLEIEDDTLGVFESLGISRKLRAARLRQDRSILDSVTDRVKQLQRRLGAADNRKVNDYLTSLRDVERRIQKTEEQSAKEVPDVARPAGIPESFDDHAHLLYDLQLLAYQSDITRVSTFMYGREQSPRPYPQIGVPEPHHPVTHHQNDPEKMAKCAKIQQYHLKLFTDYLEKLRNTPDGDGSLLDHVMILYGAASATAIAIPTVRSRRCSSAEARALSRAAAISYIQNTRR